MRKSKGELARHRQQQDMIKSAVEDERHKWQRQHRILKAKHKRTLDEVTLLKKRAAFLDQVRDIPRKLVIRPRHSRHKSETAPIFKLGDVHSFELVKPEQVNYRNLFTPKLAQQSVTTYFQRGLRLVDTHRKDTKIEDAVLVLEGDLMAGKIVKDLELCSAGPPVEEVFFVKDLVRAQLDFLLNHGRFKRIKVVCVVGNHGRTIEEKLAAGKVDYSYEYLIYHDLAREYRNVDNMEWAVAKGAHAYFDIYGQTYRVTHGDEITYQGGIGGIGIPANKAIRGWDTFIPAYCTLFGHYHQRMWYGRMVANGSVVGYNAYAIHIKAEYERPQQVIVWVGKGKGVRDVSAIYVRPEYVAKGGRRV